MGEFEGKRVTVMGLGRFGGGVGATVWLAEQGADVVATDMQTAEKLGEALEPLQRFIDSGAVTLRLGEHNVSDFTDEELDLVVVNPGVPSPWENRLVRSAQAAGIACTTEIRLVAERLPNRERVIGVTGTAGKSTTTAMIEAGLRAGLAGDRDAGRATEVDDGAGPRVLVGGNFGGSLLSRLGSIGADDWVVLELSSAMLWWLGGQEGEGPGWSPGVAVVTNFAPNHVDWHGSTANYRACKQELLRSQQAGDIAVLGTDVADWASAAGVERVVVEPSDFAGALCTPGAHNRANAAVAQAACVAALGHAAAAETAAGIGGFAGLPHRCCLVHTVGVGAQAIRFYNDSKCTVPSGVGLAVRGVGEVVGGAERVHVIAGGSDKGVDLSEIGALAEAVAGLYVIGATAEKIAMGAGGRAQMCCDLPGAIARLRERVQPGEAVLLSPGCASFGEFVNFEDRGRAFERLVKEGWHGAG